MRTRAVFLFITVLIALISLSHGVFIVAISSLPEGAYGLGCTTLNGEVYCTGAITERYNPQTYIWTDLASPQNPRVFGSLVAIDNTLWLVGGAVYNTSIDVYLPGVDTWVPGPVNIPEPFEHGGAFALNDNLYVFGVPNLQILSLNNMQWSQHPIPHPFPGAVYAVYNDRYIYAAGGVDVDTYVGVKYFDKYDTVTGIWTPLSDMPYGVRSGGAYILGTIMYVVGGSVGNVSFGHFVQMFNLITESWGVYGDNHVNYYDVGYTTLDDIGYIVGGISWTCNATNCYHFASPFCSEVYEPLSASDSTTSSLSITVSKSISASRSRSRTSSTTPSFSQSTSPSRSPSKSASRSPSQTSSASFSTTSSSSVSASKSPSFTPSNSASFTKSRTLSRSTSKSSSTTSTKSTSNSPSRTTTKSTSTTPSASLPASTSRSSSMSKSASSSLSRSLSNSASNSKTPTSSKSTSSSASTSKTASSSRSPAASVTASKSSSKSASITPANSPSPTSSLSNSLSRTSSDSNSPSLTSTKSSSQSVSNTSSRSASNSRSLTSTESTSNTPSRTSTLLHSASSSRSPLASDSSSRTLSISNSPSRTLSTSNSPSRSLTASQSLSRTLSTSITLSRSSSKSRSNTRTPSSTASVSKSPSSSGVSKSSTSTATPTISNLYSSSVTAIPLISSSHSITFSINDPFYSVSRSLTSTISSSESNFPIIAPVFSSVEASLLATPLPPEQQSIASKLSTTITLSPSVSTSTSRFELPLEGAFVAIDVSVNAPPVQVLLTNDQTQNVGVFFDNEGNMVTIKVPPKLSGSLSISVADRIEAQRDAKAELASSVLVLTLTNDQGDNIENLNASVELCFSNSEEDETHCLGYYNEKSKEWECQDKCLKQKNGLLCGETDHFTNFALLLMGRGGGDCGNKEQYLLGSGWSDFALILSVVAVVLIIGVGIILVSFTPFGNKLMRGEEGARIHKARQHSTTVDRQ